MSHLSHTTSRRQRPLPASQVAKDTSRFLVWSSFHNLAEASFDKDLPKHVQRHTDSVFKLLGRLPVTWTLPDSATKLELSRVLDPKFMEFLADAKRSMPELFSEAVKHDDCIDILRDLQVVFVAWVRLEKMRNSSRKWSEADYAGQVYNILRIQAGTMSDHRCQCSISLPQPLSQHKVNAVASSSLNARTARPDGSLFIPARKISRLSQSSGSPYDVLSRHRASNNTASHGGRSSFKWQSTLCAQLPDNPGFEIASTFWEDKKPEHKELAPAYRQNRMATTAALRQLHALNVQAPIFGLVWSEGTVRAHVDWWEDDGELRILSAAYPGPPAQQTRRVSLPFSEWNLSKPSDMVQVYLLMRNLDEWTVGPFWRRVKSGIKKLADKVESRHVTPWRRRDDVARVRKADVAEESISSSPIKRKSKKANPQTARGGG